MDNPYVPPETMPPQPLKPAGEPPATIKVFGILNIVFGSLGLVCSPFSLLAFFVPQPQGGPPNPALELMMNPTYKAFAIGAAVVGTLVAAALLAAGIGLLKLKPWGRTLSNAYGIYSIVATIAGVAMNYIFLIQPMMAQMQAQANDPQAAGAIGGAVGGLIGSCAGLIYPVLLLIFINRPNVVAALRAKPLADEFA